MIPLKMATTMKPRKRLYQPSMIVGRKGTKTSSPSVPKPRRTATNVSGDISATATLINRKDAPHKAARAKRTRYSLGFMCLTLLMLKMQYITWNGKGSIESFARADRVGQIFEHLL